LIKSQGHQYLLDIKASLLYSLKKNCKGILEQPILHQPQVLGIDVSTAEAHHHILSNPDES
jgi:hypothetical protein